MAENLAEALGRNTPPCEMIESLRQELHNDRQEPIAIFTGAGASVLFGYPLTGALLPQIVEWQDNKDFLCIGMDRDRAIGAKRRRLLRTALEALIPNVPRKPGDFPLVTTLLSIIDLAIAQRQPLWSGFDVSQLRQIVVGFADLSPLPEPATGGLKSAISVGIAFDPEVVAGLAAGQRPGTTRSMIV